MQVKALTPTFGAEITGISLADGLPDEEYRALQRAFLTYSVIVIKRQQLTTRQLVAFGERFGRIRPHPLVRRQHPDCPKVTVLASEPIDEKSQTDREGVERGSDWEIDLVGWHTDLAYEQVAAMATVVLSQEVPRVGGDMRFVSAYLAYDALPPALKERIEGRVGTFCYGGRKAWKLRHLNDGQPQLPIVEHPAILIHPETGRKALYVNPHHSLGFANMPQEDADTLLDEIFDHLIRPDWEYSHRWEKGDLVMWDNRSTLHSATPGIAPDQRCPVWRVSIMPN